MISVLLQFHQVRCFVLLSMVLLVVLSPSLGLCIQQEQYIELIPDEVFNQAKEEPVIIHPSKYRVKAFLDGVAKANIRRVDLAVPMPSAHHSGWINRLSLDFRSEKKLTPSLYMIIANRVHYLLDDNPELSGGRIQNDVREAFLALNIHRLLYLDIGRINVKSGVALGFNPTDYFKKNAASYKISADPNVLRENRLGVLMVRAQRVWERASVSIAFAPELNQERDQWWTDGESYGLRFEKTNDSNRYFCKITLNAFHDFNPEFLYFRDRNRSNFGINLTKGIGNAVVVYGEWSGSKRPNINTQALSEAEAAGAIPPNSLSLLNTYRESHFQNQLAIGLSYTGKVKRTIYLEYHFNEAGFSHADWKEWFATCADAKKLLQAPSTDAVGRGILGLLWATRQWSEDAQEPISKHSLFIRIFWEDALIEFLDITQIALINLMDGSFYTQLELSYRLRQNLTLALSSSLFIGSRQSEYGSLDPMGDIKAGFRLYF